VRLRNYVILTCLCCTAVPAEQIAGTLFDRSGAAIAGARVMLMSSEYEKLAETKSGEHGEFSFEGVKPALYFVQAKKPRFQMTQHNVQLEAGKNATLYMVANVARGDDAFTIATSPVNAKIERPTPDPVRPGGDVQLFQLIKGRPPGFPESTRNRGIVGNVAVQATIRSDGTTADLLTLEAADPELERVSLEAIRQWRYSPMKLNGVPVETSCVIVFEFRYQ